jgi:hypothetical protein
LPANTKEQLWAANAVKTGLGRDTCTEEQAQIATARIGAAVFTTYELNQANAITGAVERGRFFESKGAKKQLQDAKTLML